MVNDFLTKVLELQQDGTAAISAPANWSTPPLLEVKTELGSAFENVASSLMLNSEESGLWHFLVGSPGNGKSAAVGKLSRQLLLSDCSLRNLEDKVDISNIPIGNLPYVVGVFEKDNDFPSAWLVQDASVVKDPFSRDADTANELISLLSDAWEAGVSLILCTNRGVIERAFRKTYLIRDHTKKPWFKIIKAIVENNPLPETLFDFSPDSEKRPFSSFRFSFNKLDNKSLLIKSDSFKQLILKAADARNWEVCVQCKSNDICPFLKNRDWLFNDDGQEVFLSLLQRAELASGQIIVFREALALLSFILAGCPKDYPGDPCSWVHDKKESNDFFSLLSRRIYMCLFSSNSPFGLEESSQLYTKQVEVLSSLLNSLDDQSIEAGAMANCLDYENRLSTDVGVHRLLGPNGIFKLLDPFYTQLPSSFYDEWDNVSAILRTNNSPLITELETTCANIWEDLEDHVDSLGQESVERSKWLSRWISSFTLRIGAIENDLYAFSSELSELVSIRSLEESSEDIVVHRRESDFNEQLRDILGSLTAESSVGQGILISNHVSLAGRWSESHLLPSIDMDSMRLNLGIPIFFGDAPNQASMKNETSISALAFCWLALTLDKGLSRLTFPVEQLLAIIDSQSQAAAKSKYAFIDEDITLRITTPDKDIVKMTRLRGHVFSEMEG